MKKTLQQKLLELLNENPGISLKEAAEMLEIGLSKLKRICYRLKSMGYIERAGSSYILTERGSKYLEYLKRLNAGPPRSERPVEFGESLTSHKSVEPFPVEGDKEGKPASGSYPVADIERGSLLVKDLTDKLRNIEERVKSLEGSVRSLEKALESLRNKKYGRGGLEQPVMTYSEAITKYGSLVDRLIAENRLLRVGSLIVDAEFYSDFKSKFPLKVADVNKLSEYHRLLLEEMRKEAVVVLHGGKEFKLVE